MTSIALYLAVVKEETGGFRRVEKRCVAVFEAPNSSASHSCATNTIQGHSLLYAMPTIYFRIRSNACIIYRLAVYCSRPQYHSDHMGGLVYLTSLGFESITH